MEKFSFFNDVNGDRVYYAEDWARHLKKYFTNGIFNNELNVVSNNDMTITIKEGDANIEGYRYTNTGDLVKTIDNADGTLNRIDNVVLRLDLTNRLISAQIIKGTFADKPVAPELVRTSTIYDLRIAKISIPAGTTTITQDLITDTRFITSDCGNVISTVQTPDTENLFIQMQTLFEKQINELNNNFEIWFDSIKNQLDSDAAGNLQNQINNLNSNKVDNAKFDLDSNNLQLLANGKNVGDSVHIPTGITDTATGEEDLKIVNNKGIVKFSLEGKTEQKSYTGKNILDYVSNLKASSDGLTNVINDDGSITTTGKPTTDYTRIVTALNFIDFLEDGETYTISQQQPNEKLFIQVNAKKKDGTYSYYFGNKGKSTFKVDKATYVSYFIGVQTHTMSYWGDSLLTITNKYMLCKGTDTADTSFEPYVGTTSSPNPDYPQEIENIKGVENIWLGGESTTNNGITFTKNNDGSYDITGTATASADCINLVNIANAKLKNGINYNLSINKLTNEKVSILTEAYIENWDSHVIGPLITSTTLSTNKIINIKDNITRVRYVIRVEKGQTVNIKGLKIQLEEGPIAHNFVPNGSNYLQLKNKSENLFNYTPVLITQVKSNLRTNNIYPNSNILLKKGTYILSFSDMVMKNNIKEFGVQLFDNNTQLATLTLSNNKKSAIFTINNDANISRLYTYLDNSDNNDATITYKNIQLEKGTVATDYEPYEEKNINVDLKGNELCSNLGKTTNDELIVENSKAKINKKIKEFTFTGDEEFTKRSDGDGSTTITFNLPIHEDIVELNTVSNMFSYEQSSTSGNEGIGVSIGNNKLVYIQIKRSRLSSLDVAGFKEFLKAKYNAGTPLKIQCELIEPEVIDLGKIDFELLEGNSTLNLEEDLKSNMSIKYYTDSTVVDLKKKVENKQNVILHGTTAPSNDLGEDGDIYLQHN